MANEMSATNDLMKNDKASLVQKSSSFLALFTSTGTLLCCALPATIAAIAGGAAVGAFASTFPWLISISHYKGWIFSVALVLIVFSGILTFRPHGKLACSVTGGKGCQTASSFSRAMFWISVIIYIIGFSFAYAMVPVLRFLER